MSDRPDIVDELREIASSAYKADDDNSRLREAADEIEPILGIITRSRVTPTP